MYVSVVWVDQTSTAGTDTMLKKMYWYSTFIKTKTVKTEKDADQMGIINTNKESVHIKRNIRL